MKGYVGLVKRGVVAVKSQRRLHLLRSPLFGLFLCLKRVKVSLFYL